jgi:hypothetical protein
MFSSVSDSLIMILEEVQQPALVKLQGSYFERKKFAFIYIDCKSKIDGVGFRQGWLFSCWLMSGWLLSGWLLTGLAIVRVGLCPVG